MESVSLSSIDDDEEKNTPTAVNQLRIVREDSATPSVRSQSYDYSRHSYKEVRKQS